MIIIKRSSLKNKKFSTMVNGERIDFGAKGYKIKPGTKAGDSYCARSSGIKGVSDKNSANYWSRRMWGCVGKKSFKSKALKIGKNKK